MGWRRPKICFYLLYNIIPLPLHEGCLCHEQHSVLLTAQLCCVLSPHWCFSPYLQLRPVGRTPLTLANYISKFLSPLSAFDPLILTRSQLTHEPSSSHQRQTRSNTVLIHGTLLQMLLQVDNMPAVCSVRVCVFEFPLYTAVVLPPSSPSPFSFPGYPLIQPPERWDWTRRLPFFLSRAHALCPPCKHFILSCSRARCTEHARDTIRMIRYKLHSYAQPHDYRENWQRCKNKGHKQYLCL